MPDGNPYARMAALMRGEGGAGPVTMRLGRVTGTAPLAVSVAGLRLPKEALRVGAGLVLEAGDTVLLFSGDDQVFYAVMKVVEE